MCFGVGCHSYAHEMLQKRCVFFFAIGALSAMSTLCLMEPPSSCDCRTDKAVMQVHEMSLEFSRWAESW